MRGGLRWLGRLLGHEWFAPLASLVGLCVALSIVAPPFRTAQNFYNIGLQTAVIAIIAVGQTLVIIAGGIDLSVGSVLALSGVVTVLLMASGLGEWLCILVGLACGCFCGLVNGLLSTKARLPSFIATLGMMGIARGMALVVSKGQNISVPSGSWYPHIGSGSVLGLPIPFVITAVVAVAAHLLLSRTALGRYIYAVGGNREAARLSGINVDGVVLLTFVLCGLTVGIASVVESARLSLGQPTGGVLYELHAIAAAVIGGASLMGGQGSVVGTIIGAFLMSVIRNGADLLNVPPDWQQVMIGTVVIAAVFWDQMRRAKMGGA